MREQEQELQELSQEEMEHVEGGASRNPFKHWAAGMYFNWMLEQVPDPPQ